MPAPWPLFIAAVPAAMAALALLGLSRVVRPRDARLWHAAWTTLAIVSMVAPAMALVPPRWLIAIPAGPAGASSGSTGLSIAGLVAIGGSAIFFWRLTAGLLLTLRVARYAKPLTALDRARIDRVVPGGAAHCREHNRIRVPVAIGFRRPVVVLPESWRAWPDDRLAVILRHEYAHTIRRDFLWNFVAAAQQAMYWWNPLAWVVARRVRFTGELATDRVAAGGDAAVYARHLVATAKELSYSAWQAGILAPGAVSDLEHRVDALLSSGDDRPVGRRARRIALGLIAAGVLTAPLLVQARVVTHAPATDHAARHAERHAAAGH